MKHVNQIIDRRIISENVEAEILKDDLYDCVDNYQLIKQKIVAEYINVKIDSASIHFVSKRPV